MPNNLVLTGKPKSGKSTLLKRVIKNIVGAEGFLTEEMTQDSKRVGFKISSSSGIEFLLAHVGFDSSVRVSRYGVDIDGFEAILPRLYPQLDSGISYLDEIGEMQLRCQGFEDLARRYLDCDTMSLLTMSQIYSHPFIDEILGRNDVEVFEIDPSNRESVFESVVKKMENYARLNP